MKITLANFNNTEYHWIEETLQSLKSSILNKRFKMKGTSEIYLPEFEDGEDDTVFEIEVEFPDLETFKYFNVLYKERTQKIEQLCRCI